ncbi:MAG: SOS response-associated peptidase [Planctomycetota bacterium]
MAVGPGSSATWTVEALDHETPLRPRPRRGTPAAGGGVNGFRTPSVAERAEVCRLVFVNGKGVNGKGTQTPKALTMCGRFTLRTPAKEIAHFFQVTVPDMQPRFNIAPSQSVAAVRLNPTRQARELVMLHWGLIPFWADDAKIGYKMINARAETVAKKPAFRKAFAQRRCLVIADGFYEWQKRNGRKQPFLVHRTDHQPFAFAGLWEHWDGEGETIESCAIVVTEANELVKPIHDRMPVILDPADYPAWLDPAGEDKETLQGMLKPFPSSELEAYPVRSMVNNPQNDTEDCVERVRA